MKIVHVMSGAGVGGTQAQFERLVGVLHRTGVNQRAIVSETNAHGQRIKSAGIETIAMDLPGTFAFLDRRKINAELKRYTPDIVLSWFPAASALVERGGYTHLGRAPAQFDSSRLASCDALLAPSRARADIAIAAGWSESGLHVVPNLPSTVLAHSSTVPFDRKKNFTPATARLVITAARLVESKGIADLLGAIAKLSGVYLWIAGEGADRAQLEDRAHQLGIKPRVRFLGWQDDLRSYFAAADVFVYPARQEDLADPVVEAWAAGIPIIAADSLGPGLLIRHQDNGLLVPVGDVQGLADTIKFLLVDASAAKKLAAAGRAAYEDSFSAEKLTARYLDVFQQLAMRHPPLAQPA